MTDPQVTLAEALRELRAQILTATQEGANQPIRFVAKSVEVELGITFSLQAEAGGGFKLWSLVDLSAKGTARNDSAHKVKLVLELVGPDGGPTLIGSDQLEK